MFGGRCKNPRLPHKGESHRVAWIALARWLRSAGRGSGVHSRPHVALNWLFRVSATMEAPAKDSHGHCRSPTKPLCFQ